MFCKHGNILLSLTLKENTISNIFYYITIVEIHTQKGEHSWKCTELSLKRKEWVIYILILGLLCVFVFINCFCCSL